MKPISNTMKQMYERAIDANSAITILQPLEPMGSPLAAELIDAVSAMEPRTAVLVHAAINAVQQWITKNPRDLPPMVGSLAGPAPKHMPQVPVELHGGDVVALNFLSHLIGPQGQKDLVMLNLCGTAKMLGSTASVLSFESWFQKRTTTAKSDNPLEQPLPPSKDPNSTSVMQWIVEERDGKRGPVGIMRPLHIDEHGNRSWAGPFEVLDTIGAEGSLIGVFTREAPVLSIGETMAGDVDSIPDEDEG